MAKIDTSGAREDQEGFAVGEGSSRRWRLLHRNSPDLPPAQETDRLTSQNEGAGKGDPCKSLVSHSTPSTKGGISLPFRLVSPRRRRRAKKK